MSEGLNTAEKEGSVYPLGRYLILAELGKGGMAEVYLALSRGLNGFNKLVVLKLLRSHLAEDDTFLTMFLAEARLAARLNHANIVQTYEIGVEGGRHCIVMEYLEGRSFAEVEAATQREPMALSLGIRVIADTLAALHHAHELADVDGRQLGLVHRDVSPHNVFVTYDGQVKLLDFGIAKAADDGARTKTGVFKGKLRYTAPERFAGEESDRRSDVFSVGVMLWQLLTKKRLWSGLNELAVMQQLASRTPVPSARSVNPEVSERLDEICSKALAMSAADRFRDAAEMQDALEEVLATESFGATNRALGKYMAELFGEVRVKFQRTVDEQIRVASTIPLDFEASGSVARIRSDAIPRLGAMYGSDSLSSIPAGPPSSSSLVRTGTGGTSRPPGLAASVSPSEDAGTRSRRRGAGIFFAALFIAASILLVSFLHVEHGQGPAVARSAAASAPVAPAAVSATVAPPELVAPAASASSRAEPTPSATEPVQPSKRTVPAASPTFQRGGGLRAHAAPLPAETHAAAPAAPPHAEPPKHEVDCTSPYFIDDQGLKKIRPECL